jgi:transcriptional regulator with XRE-family HTH domain
MTIKERINLALERAGKSQRDLAKHMGKSSPAVSEMLSKSGDLDSIVYIQATSELTGVSFEALRTGAGFENLTITEESKPEYLKPSAISRGEFYQELVETNSEYSLIPKSFINGDYRIMLKSELDRMNNTQQMVIEAKNQSIAFMEKRIHDLEQMLTVSQRVQK